MQDVVAGGIPHCVCHQRVWFGVHGRIEVARESCSVQEC
jgi:hypothetical protein